MEWTVRAWEAREEGGGRRGLSTQSWMPPQKRLETGAANVTRGSPVASLRSGKKDGAKLGFLRLQHHGLD